MELITEILNFLDIFTVRKTTTQFFYYFKKYSKKQKKNYISDIFWTFKNKLQIIHAAVYTGLFLPDPKNCFYTFSIIYQYLSLLFSHFVFLFSPSFSYSFRHQTYSTFYNVWFDFMPVILQKWKTLHSPRQKKNCRVDYNQTKCFKYNNIWCKVWISFGPGWKIF